MPTIEDIKEGAKWNAKKRAPRLAALVAFIEQEFSDVYRVEFRDTEYRPSSPTMASGVRLYDYKARPSKSIKIFKRNPKNLAEELYPEFKHNSGQAYSHNREVCEWIVNEWSIIKEGN